MTQIPPTSSAALSHTGVTFLLVIQLPLFVLSKMSLSFAIKKEAFCWSMFGLTACQQKASGKIAIKQSFDTYFYIVKILKPS